MNTRKLGLRIMIGSLIFLLLYFVWLKWPRSLDAHLDHAEETIEVDVFWHMGSQGMFEYKLLAEDEAFPAALDAIRNTKAWHSGFVGNTITIEHPPLYQLYLTALEGDAWRPVGELQCDTAGNIYIDASHYTITQDAGLLAWLQSLEGERVPISS